MDKKFPEGIRVFKPGEKAPEFVKLNITIKVEEFTKWLNSIGTPEVRIDLLKSREKGTLYLALNEWKKPDSMKKGELKETGTNSDGSKTPSFDINPDEVFNSY